MTQTKEQYHTCKFDPHWVAGFERCGWCGAVRRTIPTKAESLAKLEVITTQPDATGESK